MGLLERILQQPQASGVAGVVTVKGAHQHGDVEKGLHGSALSSVDGKAVDPGRIDSDRASRSAVISPATSTGAGGQAEPLKGHEDAK